MGKRTVTLTGHAPVQFEADEWPVVARGDGWEGSANKCDATRTWTLRARRHADGQGIVYAVYHTAWQGSRGWRGGELVPPGGNIVAAIIRVGEASCCAGAVIREAIASLPAKPL